MRLLFSAHAVGGRDAVVLILPRANLALELSSQVDWNSVGQSTDGRPRDSARYADTSPCDSS